MGNRAVPPQLERRTTIARLAKLPERSIIDGFKGTIDFYLWKGIPCARKWPTWKRRDPTPAEAANQQAFAYINKQWGQLTPFIQDAWRAFARGTTLTGKDWFVVSYLSGLPWSDGA